MLTAASTCNGSGTCNGGTTSPCPGGFVCANATSCKTACASDADCESGSNFCKNPGATGTCVAKLAVGTACTANDQCASGLCAAGFCSCGTAAVSFAGAVQSIFATNCTGFGCHTATNLTGGLNLSAANAYADLVNVTAPECGSRNYVTPFSPTTSYLLDKVHGTNLCGGGQMPLGKPPLSAAAIQTLTNWICEGAPNN
jgi:hypothetical protein